MGWLPPNALEMFIGAVFIAVHSYGRYNTPDSNRSSTTRTRFVACWMLYALALVVVYWMITVATWVSPEIVARLLEILAITWQSGEAGELGRLLQRPITTALLFTSLLPNFPVLRRIDRRLLQFFWDLGEIPGHAIKLAHRMYRARFNLHPARFGEIEREARKYDIDIDCLDFDDRGTAIFVWAEVCALLLEVERWSQGREPQYRRFVERREQELEDTRVAYATLSSRVSAYYRRVAEPQGRSARVLDDLREGLLEDGRQLFMRLCKLIAHAVLSTEIGAAARSRRLEALGFELSLDDNENLNAVQLGKLSAIIFGAFLAISAFRYALESPRSLAVVGDVLFFAFLMSMNYGLAAFFGIFPKTRWRFADIEATGARPWAGYVVSGVIAVAAGLALIAALRYTRYAFEVQSHDESFDLLVENLAWSYPYLLLSFVIAFGIAWATDNGSDRWTAATDHRIDALVMSAAVAAAFVTVYAALHGLGPFEGTKDPAYRSPDYVELAYSTGAHLVVGALIGWLVPQWYRSNRYRTPVQRVVRFIDRNSHVLRVEAGRLRPGELHQALSVGTAAMTVADGTVDEVERETVRRCLGELADCEVLDADVDAAMQEAMEEIRRWQERSRDPQAPALEAVDALRGRPVLSELLVQLCAAVALSDDVFGRFEQEMLQELIRRLGLDAATCLPGCGLVGGEDGGVGTVSPAS